MSNFTATSWFLGYGDQPGVAVCDAMSLCMCFCCCTAFFKVSLVGDGSQQAGKAQSLHFSLQREHFFLFADARGFILSGRAYEHVVIAARTSP
jgi:hypothetical protein